MKGNTLFTHLLELLNVPFTSDYSDRRFETIPFRTLFGLSKLLQEYGVESAGYRLDKPDTIVGIPTPFIAKTKAGLVIVEHIDSHNVKYLLFDETLTAPTPDFIRAFDNIIFVAAPEEGAHEPDYAAHRLRIAIDKIKYAAMWILIIAIAAFLTLSSGVISHPWAIVLLLLSAAGLFFSLLLLRKGLKIKSRTADRVCAVIQAGGCDTVLDTKAASFFGIFKWSEVGTAYFSVTLLAILFFPQYIPQLAALNLCCLPFSFWSVWYQKFRAKAWCTMCLGVQTILWLSAAAYLLYGAYPLILPLSPIIILIAAIYAATLLVINHLLSPYEK